jgi:hypothetical protein
MTQLTSEQLTKNAGLINAAHRDIVQANKTSIEKAIEAGTILKACKDSFGHGECGRASEAISNERKSQNSEAHLPQE